MKDSEQYYAAAAMLIRKPVAIVFDAFIDPEITTKIWFTKSSGRLEEGKTIEWTWEMYNHSVTVNVTHIEVDKKIEIEWGNYSQKSQVTWAFTALGEDQTFVSIVNSGFQGDAAQLIAQVRDSTEGFTLVLAALKALLEKDIRLNLVGDRFPKGLQ
ncbi:SRPBCC family protein [Niabella soli]|uniref:Activator of HSP90 ATPase n=1 Tax=Niabella soli DSM 19437 TaxID=929713 RepID=W0F150_9BACT|nr:SRPBCC family protein [Niabella soli]AHF16722.1 activator of HSP90 ATPase [Niabella soli DSM 19437]